MADGPNVATQHPEHKAAASQWQRCRDLRAGSDAVKAGDYLPQPPGMSDSDFEFYKARAQYFNCQARTVQALSGAIFQREPVVAGVPEAAADQLEDLTLRDEPLDVVASRVVTELLDVGRVAIWLDMPAEMGARPFWVVIPAERVINWRSRKVGADPEQLVLVVIREDAPAGDDGDPFCHDVKTQYRELALVDGSYQARVWTAIKDAEDKVRYVPGEWVIPTRRGAALDFIPLTFAGTEGVTPEVSRPPLLDLVDVSIGHYRNSADHEQVLYYVACPTPWAAGANTDSGAPLKIGSSVVWLLEKDGRAGMLEVAGPGIASIREAMAAKERQMAALGARMLEDPSTGGSETATAVRMRHSGDASALQKIGNAASAALTRALRWHLWWWTGVGDIPTDTRVDLCKDFVQVKATPEEVRAALLALQAGEMAQETFYGILQNGGWAREGVSFEEERAAIDAQQPRLPDLPGKFTDPNAPDPLGLPVATPQMPPGASSGPTT